MDEKEDVDKDIIPIEETKDTLNEEEIEGVEIKDTPLIEENLEETEVAKKGENDPLKNVAHSLLEKGKQAGSFSLHYFKDLGRFGHDHEKMIKEIFMYSNNTHILLTLIHGLIIAVFPLLIGLKLQIMTWNSHISFGQIWGVFFKTSLALFLLSVIFQWIFAFVISAVEAVVEHHKVSLIKSLKAINVMQMVWTPFIILTAILLFLPLGELGIYIILFTLLIGFLFSSIILVKTLLMSRIVVGKSILSLFTYAVFIALLMIGFVYLSSVLISDLLYGLIKMLFLFG